MGLINSNVSEVSEPDTGDIILFKSVTCCACCVSCFTRSTTNHVGVLLKNIKIYDENEPQQSKFLEGLHVLQSGMEYVGNIDNKIALGVQIHKLSDLKTSYPLAYFRHLNIKRDIEFYKIIQNFWKEIKNAPYDLTLSTWAKLTELVFLNSPGKYEMQRQIPSDQSIEQKITALNEEIELLEKEQEQRKMLIDQLKKLDNDKSFTCSALLAYLLIQLGLVNSNQFPLGWKSVTPRFFDEIRAQWIQKAQRINFDEV